MTAALSSTTPQLPTAVSDRLLPLAEQAFTALDSAAVQIPGNVVAPAVPILYFGDAAAYARSPRRIVTVGLNPSLKEFPEQDRFRRFPGCRATGPSAEYLDGLNDYFRNDPYTSWFNTFAGLLHGLESSFYADHASTALHTDLGSPVATDPTWSKLSTPTKAQLGQLGTPLWHDLIRVLRPEVILVSVAWQWMSRIEFAGDDWRELHRITENRKHPYIVKARRLRIAGDHAALLVWGQAAQTPFGSVSYAHKVEIGRAIGELIDAR